MKAGTVNKTAALELKKLKVIAGGAPPGSVRVCSICNVVCNSDTVFAHHLAGEKHALKVISCLAIGLGNWCCLIVKIVTHIKYNI